MPWSRVPPVHSPVAFGRCLSSVLRSNPADPKEILRERLADKFEAEKVVLCGSGTQALQLAMAFACRASGRDTVALPGYACYDLVSAAVGADVRTAFYDVDADRLDPEPESLARTFEGSLAAVVVVHHFGIPAPIEGLTPAVPSGTWLIEDAAQAHGGTWSGRRLGSFAPISVLSFGRGKGWTGGAGGALLLRGAAAVEAGRLRLELSGPKPGIGPAAKLAAQWGLARPGLYALPAALPWLGLGETRYKPPSRPAAMAPAVAGFILANEDPSESEISTRRRTARLLRARLEAVEGVHLPPERGEPGYLRLPLRRVGRSARDSLTPEAVRLGVAPSYPLSLPELGIGRPSRTPVRELPGSTTLARELVTAPTHSYVEDGYIDRLANALRSFQEV
jgi:dTDP-4-amino-4,6-dideoxygalactose transaminase